MPVPKALTLNARRASALQQRPKKCVPRNSRGAVNSNRTAREVPVPCVGPGSKSAWGKISGACRAGGSGSPLRVGCRLLAPVRPPRQRGAPGPKPGRSRRPGSESAPGGRLPNSPEDADRGCAPELTQRGRRRSSKNKASGWAGAVGARPSAHVAPSPGAAGEPRRPARVPRRPPQSPFLRCRDLRNPEPREPPAPGAPAAVGAGTKVARRAGAPDFSFGGVCVWGGG